MISTVKNRTRANGSPLSARPSGSKASFGPLPNLGDESAPEIEPNVVEDLVEVPLARVLAETERIVSHRDLGGVPCRLIDFVSRFRDTPPCFAHLAYSVAREGSGTDGYYVRLAWPARPKDRVGHP